MHLEKKMVGDSAYWWNALLVGEEELDVGKMHCEREMETMRQDDLDVINRERYDQHQEKLGLPTSKESNMSEQEKLMRQAWSAPGSPFSGQKFDMSIVNQRQF